MTFRTRRDITYAELREGEQIIDRSGNGWQALGVKHHTDDAGAGVTFWLAGDDGVRVHRLTKSSTESVTVIRPTTQGGEEAAREAEVDAADAATSAEPPVKSVEAAAAVVVEHLGGEEIAAETAAHADARHAAEAGEGPLVLPSFLEFTDPEKRSHLYLVHGIYAADLRTTKALVDLHDEAHAEEEARERPARTPHEHRVGAPVPA